MEFYSKVYNYGLLYESKLFSKNYCYDDVIWLFYGSILLRKVSLFFGDEGGNFEEEIIFCWGFLILLVRFIINYLNFYLFY
jgi:hypothetical protein